MKKLSSILKSLCAVAIVAVAAGCATGNTDRDRVAIAAGFKVVSPTTPEQKTLYAKLPRDTVTPVRYKGGTYYMLPDATNQMLLVGNSAQYSVYQEMRYNQRMNKEDAREAEDNELNNVDWGAWGGGGVVFVGAGVP